VFVLAAAVFRFLRRASRPNTPRPPAKSGKAAGSGVAMLLIGSANASPNGRKGMTLLTISTALSKLFTVIANEYEGHATLNPKDTVNASTQLETKCLKRSIQNLPML
jgi:hypothetical protein